MTIIKSMTQPARLSFAISLVSLVALVSLLVAHESAHGDVLEASDGGGHAEHHFCLVEGFG